MRWLARTTRRSFSLYSALRESIEHLKQHAVGAVFNAIVVDTFKRIPFLMPDTKNMRLFEVSCSPMFNRSGTLAEKTKNSAPPATCCCRV